MARKMMVVQVGRPGGPFEYVERDVPAPGPGEVLVAVEACGICHSDCFVKDGLWPGLAYPRVPGHEVAGRIERLGAGVEGWQAGDRVGVGWHGGHCFTCASCRRGDFVTCARGQVTGLSRDGGYAEFVLARQEALARIPDGLDAAEAAPLLCAGVTTYNSLRHAGARGGDLVAVLGMGGLGHLAVQYASRMGFRTVAVSRGHEKEKHARELGADLFIDSDAVDVAATLERLGGARVILATAPDSRSISEAVGGLGVDGRLVVLAAPHGNLEIPPVLLISGRRSVTGWPSGQARDSEETLAFSVARGIRPLVERFPLDGAAEAYERMLTTRVRFRVVLEPRA